MGCGELRADLDLELFVETLMAVYLRNYRKAYYARLEADALAVLIERQVGLLFVGVRSAWPAEPRRLSRAGSPALSRGWLTTAGNARAAEAGLSSHFFLQANQRRRQVSLLMARRWQAL